MDIWSIATTRFGGASNVTSVPQLLMVMGKAAPEAVALLPSVSDPLSVPQAASRTTAAAAAIDLDHRENVTLLTP
ncbi:hypothetical protein KIF24_31335 [Micromonospora sp. Llam7]|uniref:hypothetical protein n=1 Tax=Micromonospora tarapacensis TaxID=2835305 RepID=UPI001C82D5E4|nr:hypothetical protein [Micromonospora tarapacensis]MBX7270075.1 hypothetical protein [Micromonospora tarapacensis]